MFSIVISGVLFLSQAAPFVKPLIDIGSLMCSVGNPGACGG